MEISAILLLTRSWRDLTPVTSVYHVAVDEPAYGHFQLRNTNAPASSDRFREDTEAPRTPKALATRSDDGSVYGCFFGATGEKLSADRDAAHSPT